MDASGPSMSSQVSMTLHFQDAWIVDGLPECALLTSCGAVREPDLLTGSCTGRIEHRYGLQMLPSLASGVQNAARAANLLFENGGERSQSLPPVDP